MLQATKQQEREALAKIRKILEGLGEDNHISAALYGAWMTIDENIESGYLRSATESSWRAGYDERSKENKIEIASFEKENDYFKQQIETYKTLIANEKELSKLQTAEIWRLKAKLYDLTVKEG
jgi:hypothetical protein